MLLSARTRSSVLFSLASSLFLWASPAFAEVENHALLLKEDRIQEITLQAPASAMSVRLGGNGKVEMQVQEGGVWSPWIALEPDTDASPFERESQLLVTDDTRQVRLRSSDDMEVTVHSIRVSDAPVTHKEATARQFPLNAIIRRSDWGADENLRIAKKGRRNVQRLEDSEIDINVADAARYCDLRARLYPEEFTEHRAKFFNEEGVALFWPQGYSSKINLFVVHHTAESLAGTAKKTGVERMRAIYQYHAVSRGWGDIGYNFVIDPEGNIYEGRAGGAFVAGAHTFCNNVGTIGIALMGNFQGTEPPKAQMQGLRTLLVQLSDEYGVDPTGTAIHHGKLYPTIIGHRDLRQTACPGAVTHVILPQVRLAVKERDIVAPLYSPIVVAAKEPEAIPLNGIGELQKLDMGERKTLSLKFRNSGKDTWKKSSWLLGEADKGMFFVEFPPHSFVAGAMQEESVKPGEVGTFIAELQGGLSQISGSLTLTPVINNIRRLAVNAVRQTFSINPGSPRYTPVVTYFPPLHTSGQDLTGTIKLVNAGNVFWEQGTVTELSFGLEGGNGDVTILNHPKRIAPGEQGSFLVRLQNVEEEGPYERILVPQFSDGSPLIGSTITVASRAEPLPAVAFASNAYEVAQSASAIRRGRVSSSDIGVIEVIDGTELTLTPRQQIAIKLRLRAGEKGIAKSQGIAPVVLSDSLITLRDETGGRLRDVFRSPASLLKFQTFETPITLVAPRKVGSYTFSIGDIRFALTVTPSSRFSLGSGVQRLITRRTTSIEERQARFADRRIRHALISPPPPARPGDVIRIRLMSVQENAMISASSPVTVEGEGHIIVTDGSIHLFRQEKSCQVSSKDGEFIAPVIRITPNDPRGVVTFNNMDRKTNRFRGTLECHMLNGTMTWINELTLEDYLAGLAEEPDSEPWEKQRAFAIAARSYALHYVISGQRKFPGLPYDGSDSPREFQAYGGVVFEEQNPRWVEAVRNTAGEVLMWQRQVIKAPYFSSDDGKTRSALDVWGWETTPYLDAKDDPWCLGMINSGHGVGMSGCGAEGQANEGETAEAILSYYYPGTKIIKYDPTTYGK
jgi:hypothetical protein